MWKKGSQKYNIGKEKLVELYINQKRSFREISRVTGIPKTTVESYLKKYGIKIRKNSHKSRLRYGKTPWSKGQTKETDQRLKEMGTKISKTKIGGKIRRIEKKYGKRTKEILEQLYVNGGFSQERTAKELQISRELARSLLIENKIKIRSRNHPTYIRRGDKHPMYGKTWNMLYGIEEAKRRKKIAAERFRRLTIERIKKKQFPFKNTSIEKAMRGELKKRNWPVKEQVPVRGKFVCDFALPGLAIECDGDFWHANPAIYDRSDPSKLSHIQQTKIKNDKRKEELLKKRGLEIIRFFESDIKRDVEKCVDEIEKKLAKMAFEKAGDIWKDKN